LHHSSCVDCPGWSGSGFSGRKIVVWYHLEEKLKNIMGPGVHLNWPVLWLTNKRISVVAIASADSSVLIPSKMPEVVVQVHYCVMGDSWLPISLCEYNVPSLFIDLDRMRLVLTILPSFGSWGGVFSGPCGTFFLQTKSVSGCLGACNNNISPKKTKWLRWFCE